MKIDPETGNKRKLSKRKDPEASLQFYEENGYPQGAVIEYLLSIINSNFEIWRKKNSEIHYKDFPFAVKNIGNSAALFDIAKLDDVSKEYISRLTPQTVLEEVLQWAEKFNREYFEKLNQNREFAEKVFEIAYKQARPRKDFATWKQTENVYRFFYERPQNQTNEITRKYAEIYSHNDPKDVWYDKVKKLAELFNYASDNKIYKSNPDNFVGNIGDFMTIIRLALTGNANSPDLYDIMQILGEKETLTRFTGE
jgi:glutamyl-tRNA synthetase